MIISRKAPFIAGVLTPFCIGLLWSQERSSDIPPAGVLDITPLAADGKLGTPFAPAVVNVLPPSGKKNCTGVMLTRGFLLTTQDCVDDAEGFVTGYSIRTPLADLNVATSSILSLSTFRDRNHVNLAIGVLNPSMPAKFP